MLLCFLSMDSKKSLALVGKSVKETGRFGKMIPNLDGGDCDPQLIVSSGLFQDILYVVRVEFSTLKLYVFWNTGEWRGVPFSSLGNIIYEGFRDEYNELAEIVKAVNELNKDKKEGDDL